MRKYEALSFDCYGTLIDWEGGILDALRPVLESHEIFVEEEGLLELYADSESGLEKGKYERYSEILRKVMNRLGGDLGFEVSPSERDCLVDALKNWKPFPDTVEALGVLKQNFPLALISNVDEDLLAHSLRHLKIPFDWVVTSEKAGTYKPSLRPFQLALERIGQPAGKILHVAQSLYHDILPARELGMGTVWVNRRKGKRGGGATPRVEAARDFEVTDLKELVHLLL